MTDNSNSQVASLTQHLSLKIKIIIGAIFAALMVCVIMAAGGLAVDIIQQGSKILHGQQGLEILYGQEGSNLLCPPPDNTGGWYRTYVEPAVAAQLPQIEVVSESWESDETEDWITCFNTDYQYDSDEVDVWRFDGSRADLPPVITLLADEDAGIWVHFTEGYNLQDGSPYRQYTCKIHAEKYPYVLFYMSHRYYDYDWNAFIGACIAMADNINRGDVVPLLQGIPRP